MKKTVIATIVALACAGTASAFIDSYVIKRDKLPEEAQEMLETYFPKAKVSLIKIDRHLLKKTDYDVKMTNGTLIEFSNSGKWKVVDCGKREVPEELVPKAIRRWLNKNEPDLKVNMVQKKTASWLIRLSDGTVRKFDLLGTYKGIQTADEAAEAEEAEGES